MARSVPTCAITRADISSMARMLLAVLVLVARLLGPAVPPAQAADLVTVLGPLAICHAAADPAAPAPEPPNSPAQQHDCLLCPACDLASAAILPAPGTAAAAQPTLAVAGRPCLPPPSTGPPHPARLAARPTGPPAASA